MLLPLIKRITRNQVFFLIGISWGLQFCTSFLVYKWGGILESDSQNQYSLKIWLNTLNPAINVAFFLIGIGMKREFIPILKNKLIGLSIVILGQLMSHMYGLDMLFIWPPILWAIFSMCLHWTPRSKILQKTVTFIGQRTYGIFFIHFIILSYIQDFVWVKQLPQIFGLRNWIIFLFTILASAALAELSWRLIERPMIEFSRKYIGRS
jgi:peptidoglycan/LPS O-acetylase OafA/YrhL